MRSATAAPAGAAVPVRVAHAGRLRGELRLPGDKSITHRALILAAFADGVSTIAGASDGLDCRATAACLAALGAEVPLLGGEPGRVTWRVRSGGPGSWREPAGVLDCANSGTTLRLLAGALAGRPFRSILDGDASLRRRPLARIIEPLRLMGATLFAPGPDPHPPLTVVGHAPLRSTSYRVPVLSAQVKSAILLAGLGAEGRTAVVEPVVTRDHTERMLRARGVRVGQRQVEAGSEVSVEGGGIVRAVDERVPGDISGAAFWLVAGAAHPDAELTIRGCGVNPTRRAIIDILLAMGAEIEVRPAAGEPAGVTVGAAGADAAAAEEPVADLVVRSSELHAVDLGPDDVARAIDEIPVLAVAAACARGTTRFRGAGELRHKESDRLAGIATGLAAFGAEVALDGDDLAIGGARPLRGAAVTTRGDHRFAMAFAVAGLIADGVTIIDDAASAAVSYPAFFDDVERVRA
ncbi:MAG: 3-phosphoshikimate 1-carboxyvinyltransferase [Chloroflexi bacterium GWC2_73_18]|nr:MAG: 3-phosphoshikimate 1-carboxyvinyltransferase [Chloroflexi bacterium GWC2_73_18]